MKIALITNDGKTISQHFGRAPYYLVVDIQDGQVTNRELREKVGHNQFQNHGHEDHHGSEGHGFGAESHGRHTRMVQAVADCEVVISGGMGAGAYESLRRLNIKPILTDLTSIDEIIQAHQSGTLVDRTDLLH